MDKRKSLSASAVLVTLLVAATIAGCTGGPPKEAVGPGVDKGWLGGIEVVGYLEGSASAGEEWAVYDVKPSADSAVQPRILATLRPGSVDAGGIEALEGRYVWAAGRGSGDVPEIKVDGIEPAEEP